jgi:hypothetical protein
MKSLLPLTLVLALSPLAAFAAVPAVGDILGTNADDATKVLEAAGCPVKAFELEDGKIEAQCTETATGKVWDMYIDPTSGAVTEVKESDD